MKKMIIVIIVTSLCSVLLAQGTNGMTKTAKVEGVIATAAVSTATFISDVITDNGDKMDVTKAKENEEEKIYKNNRIVKEDGFLRFRDKSGKLKKEFGLKERRENVTVFDNNEKTKKRTETKREWKLSAVSPNGENAVVITNVDNPLDKNTRKIEVFDNEGNVIWKKELSNGRTVWMDSEGQKDVQSGDGGIVAINSTDSEGEDSGVEVFDRTGLLIFKFPNQIYLQKYEYANVSRFMISPNGRYIALEVQKPGMNTLVIYDLKTERNYDFEKPYYIISINNDFIVLERDNERVKFVLKKI